MLFISHHKTDLAAAEDLQSRAIAQGYDELQIFLASDSESGIKPGEDWQQIINDRLKQCRALIVVFSPKWRKSVWCPYELGAAEVRGIPIFPVVIRDSPIDDIVSKHQAVNVFKEKDAAFSDLWKRLEKEQLGPSEMLPWPGDGGDTCPFPGLQHFSNRFAPVYFGRQPETATVLKLLNSMRDSGEPRTPLIDGEPRLLMIHGGSGSGKSSLMQAGVLPRLNHRSRRSDWLVLPTLRYADSNDSLSLLGILARNLADCFPENDPSPPDWERLRTDFESEDAEQAAREFIVTTQRLTFSLGCRDATTLLPIDQFEELLAPAADHNALKFLRFMRAFLFGKNRQLLAIGTLRSESLDVYERHLFGLQPPYLHTYRLPPFPWERVTDVIVEPAARVGVTFTRELVERLKLDAPTSDALPLLAFMLEKLFRESAGDNLIDLRNYEQLGGMTGAITQAVKRILPTEMQNETEQDLRRCFVNHLSQVNENDEFVRRRARWDAIPEAAKPILKDFIFRERLLHRTGSKGEHVEVSHEAIFRCWDKLKKWLEDDLPLLRLRRRMEALAEEWQHSRKQANPLGDDGLLLTRAQLASLDEWRYREADVALSESEASFVKASRERRNSDDQREVDRLRQLVDAQIEKTRSTRRLMKLSVVMAFVGLISICVSIWALRLSKETWARAQDSESRRLASIALELQNSRPIEGLLLAVNSAEVELKRHPSELHPMTEQALVKLVHSQGGIPYYAHSGKVTCSSISLNLRLLFTGGNDSRVYVWRIEKGGINQLNTVLPGSPPTCIAFQDKHLLLAIGKESGGILVGKVKESTGELTECKHLAISESGVKDVAFFLEGRGVAALTKSGKAIVWDLNSSDSLGRTIGLPAFDHAFVFSKDSSGVASKIVSISRNEEHNLELPYTKLNGNVFVNPEVERPHRTLYRAVQRLKGVADTKLLNPYRRGSLTTGPSGEVIAIEDSKEGAIDFLDSNYSFPAPSLMQTTSTAFDPLGLFFCVGNENGDVEILPSNSLPGFSSHKVDGLGSSVSSLAIAAGHEWIAAGHKDGRLTVYRLQAYKTPERALVLHGHNASINTIQFLTNHHVITASSDGSLRVWDLNNISSATSTMYVRERESIRERPAIPFTAYHQSTDPNCIACAGAFTVRVIRKLNSNPESTFLDWNSFSITAVAASRTRIVAGNLNGDLRIWKYGKDGIKNEPDIPCHDFVSGIVINEDGTKIVSSCLDGCAKLHNKNPQNDQFSTNEIDRRQCQIHCIAANSNLSLVATGGGDGVVRIFTLHHSTLRDTSEVTMASQITSLGVGPQGKLLVAGTSDGSIGFWPLDAKATGGKILTAHQGAVTSICFSSNGERFATSGTDKKINIWKSSNLKNGAVPLRLPEQLRPIVHLSFEKDDASLRSVDMEGMLKIWKLSPSVLCNSARQIAGRSLTLEEKRGFGLEGKQ